MATHAVERRPSDPASLPALREGIRIVLSQEPWRPRCVHGLYEELTEAHGLADRDVLLMRTQLAADELAADGELYREAVSAVMIGVECQDTLYWSKHAGIQDIEKFGPDYERLAVLHRLGAHFRCHGL
jgi:hypothetical protein